MNKIKATVFIPTWFGEQYLDELLASVFNQDVPFHFDVLVYDTSSTDGTISILDKYLGKYDNFRYKVISKDEFGHGRTRNAAAHDAKGEIMVYLSQDATPAHNRWLYEIVKPFELDEKIVGVMGKQDPRSHCFPLLKNEIKSVFANLGPDFGTTIFYKDGFAKDEGMLDVLGFYSDVNSAARRSFLINQIPYRDVPYAEDQMFGRDIIEAGYHKGYAPRANVTHSNEMKLSEYKNRMFDETIGLRKIGKNIPIPSLKFILKTIITCSTKDSVRIFEDKQYSLKRKLYWLVINPLYHIEKWRGVRLGAKTQLDDNEAFDKYSFEMRRDR